MPHSLALLSVGWGLLHTTASPQDTPAAARPAADRQGGSLQLGRDAAGREASRAPISGSWRLWNSVTRPTACSRSTTKQTIARTVHSARTVAPLADAVRLIDSCSQAWSVRGSELRLWLPHTGKQRAGWHCVAPAMRLSTQAVASSSCQTIPKAHDFQPLTKGAQLAVLVRHLQGLTAQKCWHIRGKSERFVLKRTGCSSANSPVQATGRASIPCHKRSMFRGS